MSTLRAALRRLLRPVLVIGLTSLTAGCQPEQLEGSGGADDPTASDTDRTDNTIGSDTDLTDAPALTDGPLPEPWEAAPTHDECSGFDLTAVIEWTEENLIDGEPVWDSEEVATNGPGVSVGDLNNDNWLDVVVAAPPGNSQVFMNNGSGSLFPARNWRYLGEKLGVAYAVALADLNSDGWLDVYFSRPAGTPDEILYNNEGDGFYHRQPIPNSLGEFKTVNFADADGDGDLDIFAAGFHFPDAGYPTGNALYLQEEDGSFTDVRGRFDADVREAKSYLAGWVDADEDGDLDIYLVNDHGQVVSSNRMLINDGAGHFTRKEDCGCELPMQGMGFAVSDPNDDGRPDFYMTNVGADVFLQSLGDGDYVDTSLLTGLITEDTEDLTTWGATFADLDQDGWDELAVVAGGYNYGSTDYAEERDSVFRGKPDGTFEDVTALTDFGQLGTGRSVAVGDFNRDGFPDLVTAGWLYLQLWITNSECRPGVTVKLRGPQGNRYGIGAMVRVKLDDRIYTRWMLPSTTYSSSAHEWYLGLGNALQADWIKVTWPDGEVSFLDTPQSGQRITVRHPSVE